ncbi:ASCH domain-containing protein [Nocardia sp. 2YAB30]|uniref:ASCH domain-containing protein n=1 Tax=unclassified Nocardia TaxID=2637762 RepID=UPI003F9A39AC
MNDETDFELAGGTIDLPTLFLGPPGPMRDRLAAAVLDGAKTARTHLLRDSESGNLEYPVAGDRLVVSDSTERAVAIVEITDATVIALGDVDLAHAAAEGLGHTDIEQWRADHIAYWHSASGTAEPIDRNTLVVAERFRVVRPARVQVSG